MPCIVICIVSLFVGKQTISNVFLYITTALWQIHLMMSLFNLPFFYKQNIIKLSYYTLIKNIWE